MFFEKSEGGYFRENSGAQKSAQKFRTGAADQQARKPALGSQDHPGPIRVALEQAGYLTHREGACRRSLR